MDIFPSLLLGLTFNENKSNLEEISMQEIKKLYRAYSVVNYLDDNPFMIWYNADNKMSVEDYKDIIKDYTKMAPEKKRMAERFVNEFFTLNQIIFLNQFLKDKLGTELMVEECSFPINLQNMDNCISDVENAPETETIRLNKLDTYDLSFMVKGIYLQSGSTNEILDKIVSQKSSSNKMVNGDQFHEETMQQMLSEAFAAGRVKMLGGASLEDVLGSLAAGRVRFVAVNDPAELGIE
jgi:hypothetical protein